MGDIIIAGELNAIANVKLAKGIKGFNLELEHMAKFPVYCIPFSTIDKNAPTPKKPIYFIKQEFEDSFYLYKNNIQLMPIAFPDKKYIADIAANNGTILMITDIHFYVIEPLKKKITRLTLWNRWLFNLSEIKNIFFSTIVPGIKPNEFFATAIKTQRSFILHIKYNRDKKNAEILNIIDSVGNRSLGLVNGVTVTKSGLYVSEKSENIIKYNFIENGKVDQGEVIHIMKDHDIITLHGKTVFDNHENKFVDLLLVNSKKSRNMLPSSKNLVNLIKIEENVKGETGKNEQGKNEKKEKGKESHSKEDQETMKRLVRVYNIIDLFSDDMNYIYFDIYDIYFSFDEIRDRSHTKGINKIMNALKHNVKKMVTHKKKQKDNFFSENVIKIIWTNTYNCSINKGLISFDKMKQLDSNYEKIVETKMNRLPFEDARTFISLAPYVYAVSHCSLKKKSIFKSLCYYNADENSVSYINKAITYNSDFRSAFYFDGIKDFLAFDYKSYATAHILTYPYNNTVFIHTADINLKINLPAPLGISVDTEKSNEHKITFYIAGNDDQNNYINKCVVDLMNADYECYDTYVKKRNGFELFQYITYISYNPDIDKTHTVIYIANNNRSVYMLNKIGDKHWKFQLCFQLENANERVGVITTSVSYVFANKKALERLIKEYPVSPILQRAKTQFELKKTETNKKVVEPSMASDEIVEDDFTFLAQSHVIIYAVNKNAYGYEYGTTLHFYSVLLREKYYLAFAYNALIQNISNQAKFNYYLTE